MDIAKIINSDEVIKVVQDMVQIPSVNPPGNEQAVADYIIAYMESKGIETSILEVDQGRYNVVARLKGQGKADPILFTGHMDVVPVSKDEEKKWRTDPFTATIDGDFLYGRGSADMKGGLGAAMVAMGTLAEHNIQPPGDIILAATVDEEDVMRGAKALIKSSLVADAKRMVVCEPSNMDIQVACRGRTWADIKVAGETAHASVQGDGINAIERAVVLAQRIANHRIPHEHHALLGESFWQVTLINGGIEPAIVPDSCTITVDGRLVPGQMPVHLWEQMEKIIASLQEEMSDFHADIKVIEAREPWEISKEDPFVKVIAGVYQKLGLPVNYAGFSGTTDGTVFRRIGIEGVILGPGELANNVHKENERVSLKQLQQAAEVYALTMLDWDNNK